MTYLEAIGLADILAPNALPQDRKVRWLREAEGLVEALVPGQQPAAACLTDSLRAGPPWDSLYVYWLTMQIHYAHGDTPRYNQANAMYQAFWTGFRDHHNRTTLPEKTALRYF